MTNEKKSNMSAEQKLYPQLIYRINSILSDIKSKIEKYYKEGELFIAPSVLDPHTRTFNWLMVNDEKWKFLGAEDRKDIENHIKSNWKKFEKEFIRRKEMKTVSDAIDIVKKSANKTDEEYHFALLSIYQFYPNNPRKYIDGIIYRNIARRAKERNGKNHRIDYAQVTLQCGEENKKTYILYPWVKINFFDNEGPTEIKYSCQEFNPSDPEKEITKGYPADDNPDVDKPEEIRPLESESDYKKYGWGEFTPATLRTNHFHKNYFVPFFVKDEGFNPKKFYKLSSEYLSQRKYIYVKPLYDALYGEYGNLCAVLQIPFVKTTERDKFSDVKNILINRLPFLVNEIKNAAFFEILKQPIEGDDLLEHFIKYLPMLQDWEYIRVFENKNGGEVILNYCYGRAENGEWKKCPLRGSNCATKPECLIQINANSYELEDEELKKIIRDAKKKHIACNEIRFGKGHKHKALLENIFTEGYIPELDEYDKSKCENKIVIYEYPSYTIIPDDEREEHKLGLFYERQQIDLLRQLALKRKVILETTRHGSIAAMTAIVARNLSHNIGSHVLSRWIMSLNDLLKDEDWKSPSEIIKKVTALLSEKDTTTFCNKISEFYKTLEISKPLFQYIQHRMDFIAEVATSIPSSEMTMDFQRDIFEPFKEQKVLLEKIANSEGFDDLTKCFIVEVAKSCERVSIPNGVIGTHAIYSILENFIRNAAKHYKCNSKELEIRIELKIPDRVKLKSKPNNGKKIDKVVFDKSNVLTIKEDKESGGTFILTKNEQQEIKDLFSDEDKEILERFFHIHERYIELRIWDMRQDSCNDEILEKLRSFSDRDSEDGRLIDEKGIINPGGWGIKEMIVSSNFLRKNSPEKLIGDMAKNEPSIMEIICDDDSDKIACKNGKKTCHRSDSYKDKLGIRFYLRRPKDMYMIGNEENRKITKDKFEIEYTNTALKKGERLTEDIPHRLLFVNESIKNCYEDDPMAPMRIMTYAKNDDIKDINDTFYLNKYEEFIKGPGEFRELPILRYGGGSGRTFFTGNSCYLVDNTCYDPANYAKSKDSLPFFYYHANGSGEECTIAKLIEDKKYFQPVSGAYTSVVRKLEKLPTDKLYQKHFLLELIESALTKVIIIDERVSDLADKDAFHGKKIRDILDNMKIDVLKVDKENITYESIEEKLKSKNAIKSSKDRKLNNYKYHFLVIHQGILDKVKKNSRNHKALIEMIDCRWKVIDSGRGVPMELGDFPDARFVETSALMKMLEVYDKHGLVQTLFSLRRPLVNKE